MSASPHALNLQPPPLEPFIEADDGALIVRMSPRHLKSWLGKERSPPTLAGKCKDVAGSSLRLSFTTGCFPR
jgi:hypothetical protein